MMRNEFIVDATNMYLMTMKCSIEFQNIHFQIYKIKCFYFSMLIKLIIICKIFEVYTLKSYKIASYRLFIGILSK